MKVLSSALMHMTLVSCADVFLRAPEVRQAEPRQISIPLQRMKLVKPVTKLQQKMHDNHMK